MTAVIDEFNIDEVRLNAPRDSQSGDHRSAHASKTYRFQIGEQTDMKCTLLKKNGRGMLIHLHDEAAAKFIHDFEAYCTDYLFDHSKEWFGRAVDRGSVRRMLLSVVNRDNEIQLRASKNMKMYLLYDDETVEEVDEVEGSREVVPIMEFKGLYIKNRSFSLSFCVNSLLIGKKNQSSVQQAFFDPGSLLNRQQHEDLENPHDVGFEGWEEVSGNSSHGSFHTEVWHGH